MVAVEDIFIVYSIGEISGLLKCGLSRGMVAPEEWSLRGILLYIRRCALSLDFTEYIVLHI